LPWQGHMAIVAVFNRVISEAEIQSFFNATRKRFGI